MSKKSKRELAKMQRQLAAMAQVSVGLMNDLHRHVHEIDELKGVVRKETESLWTYLRDQEVKQEAQHDDVGGRLARHDYGIEQVKLAINKLGISGSERDNRIRIIEDKLHIRGGRVTVISNQGAGPFGKPLDEWTHEDHERQKAEQQARSDHAAQPLHDPYEED